MAKKTKSSVNKSLNSAKKFESDLPEMAKKYNIRVSNPYGYYPEDVEKIIFDLESQINRLEKENFTLTKKNGELENDVSQAKREITQLKVQMTIMGNEMPDTSAETDFAMLGRGLTGITGKVEPQIIEKPIEGTVMPIDTIGEPDVHPTKATHNNLVRPKLNIKPKPQ